MNDVLSTAVGFDGWVWISDEREPWWTMGGSSDLARGDGCLWRLRKRLPAWLLDKGDSEFLVVEETNDGGRWLASERGVLCFGLEGTRYAPLSFLLGLACLACLACLRTWAWDLECSGNQRRGNDCFIFCLEQWGGKRERVGVGEWVFFFFGKWWKVEGGVEKWKWKVKWKCEGWVKRRKKKRREKEEEKVGKAKGTLFIPEKRSHGGWLTKKKKCQEKRVVQFTSKESGEGDSEKY